MSGFNLFGSYNKEGKGVSKNQNKGRVKVFFEIFFRKFWKLIELNMLYFIFCIPIFTIGPATAAFTKILRNYSQERNAFLFADFLKEFKSSFKSTVFVGLFDVLIVFVFTVSIMFYTNMTDAGLMKYLFIGLTYLLLLLVTLAHFYLYLMIVSTNVNIKEAIKNSLILGIIELKTNAITLLLVLLIVIPVVLFIPFSLIFIPFFPLSWIGFIICYNSYPKIRKHVIQPFYDQTGEQNPELDYLYPSENGEEAKKTVFKDNVN